MSTYMTAYRNPAWNRFAELDRLFEAFRQPQAGVPAELEEAQDHYLLSLEVPGIPRDKLRIELADDVLSVSGEGRRGRFERSFTLPAGVDASKIEAHSENGVLQLYVPKPEQAKPRQIQISQGQREAREQVA